MTNRFYLAAIMFCLAISTAAQSGGQFAIGKSVVAGGGQSSTGGQFSIDATSGQTIAGQKAAGGAFSLHAGFWNPDQFVPTAAEVTVGGLVRTASGRGIRNVRVTMTDANGASRTAVTGTFGYFRFTGVPAGEIYTFTATAKRYQFTEPSQVLNVVDDVENLSFVAVDEP
jgi:hypothetical protein